MQLHPETKLMKKDGLIIFSEKLSTQTIGKVDKNFNERKLVKCRIGGNGIVTCGLVHTVALVYFWQKVELSTNCTLLHSRFSFAIWIKLITEE